MKAFVADRAERRWSAADRGMVHLVRLVLADDWHPAAAAAALVRQVDDPRVLRQMAVRVRRARAERSSLVAERAAITLELAMGAVPTS